MFKIYRIKSINKPEKLISLNNGVWYYNYDIVAEKNGYSYAQVRVNGPVTVDKCWEAVLKAYNNESNTTLYRYNLSPSKDLESEELISLIYHNVRVDFGLEEPISELELVKNNKIKEIEKYDTSTEVNSFYLNGNEVWLDKSTRVGLQNSIAIEVEAGRAETTLWFNGTKIIVGCTLALLMLSILELYALNCYNKTAEHKNNVQNLDNIEAVMSYDYTQGYPDKPEFNI